MHLFVSQDLPAVLPGNCTAIGSTAIADACDRVDCSGVRVDASGLIPDLLVILS